MKTAWYSKKWVVVLLHAAAWILLFSLPALLRPSYNKEEPAHQEAVFPGISFLLGRIMDITWMVSFYLNALVLMPRLTYRKKYWRYAGIQIIVLAWILVQSTIIFKYLAHPGEYFDVRRPILFNSLSIFLCWLPARLTRWYAIK